MGLLKPKFAYCISSSSKRFKDRSGKVAGVRARIRCLRSSSLSILSAQWSDSFGFSPSKMSSEAALSTPKAKKRVHALVAFYEEIGTPGRSAKRAEPETPSHDLDQTPSKKRKLREAESEAIVEKMEVVEAVIAPEPSDEAGRSKESRSARKSRRMKESALPKYSKRVFCANEVLSTERTYVEVLQNMHKVRLAETRFRMHFVPFVWYQLLPR